MSAPAIVIAAADASWAESFAVDAALIRESLGELALRVDHVGSTSVPGLAAKPVIDIQISVARLHPMDPWHSRLEALGYHYHPFPDDSHYPFLHRPAGWPHSHHIHVCTAGSHEEKRHLAFRDYLRDHPSTCREYEDVKRQLAAEHDAASIESRNAYADAKSDFIDPIVEQALAAGYPH